MKTITFSDVLIKTSESLENNFKSCISRNEALINEMVEHLNLLYYWSEKLSDVNCVPVLREVNYDLLSSIYISANGMYRNAFICLRSALELGLSFFYFVDNNFKYLQWKKNDFDMKWSLLQDHEDGVLSKKYMKLFKNNFKEEIFIEEVQDVYRSCSEYVHGKYEYMHTLHNQQILFDQRKFEEFAKTFLKVAKLITVYMVIRFSDKQSDFIQDKLVTTFDIAKVYFQGEIA
ncbi:hypothetical protein YDYSG_61440 [Paenibacillus tyrfis]|uniref:hypothetical protein n=1 Tax=Paenibacillus tyrfis TaxID=1501230 RepID=UPI00248FBCCF|nr:hypothetical protein [Paenibacillus tyrfis]GLI10111.1 hypothetical protein YDYSG_61440 [Paenibacillus tyrfis]